MKTINLRNVFFLGFIILSLQGCAKPFEHTVFNDEIYGPWRSTLGARPQNCYGRERQIPECLVPWKLEEQLKKDPKSAITEGTLEQIRAYALYADEDTAAAWIANGLIYQLKLISPRPEAETSSSQLCRTVKLRVKPQNSDMPWQDLSDRYCFDY